MRDLAHFVSVIRAMEAGPTWMRSGRNVSPHDAKELLTVLAPRGVSSQSNAMKLRFLYSSLVEAMANTREHAGPDASWQLLAQIVERRSTRTALVVFADDGCGLVSSLRMNGEIGGTDEVALSQFFQRVSFRSPTKGRRGLGYAALKSANDRGLIEDTTLVANGVSYNLTSREATRIAAEAPSNGTLLAFKVSLESEL